MKPLGPIPPGFEAGADGSAADRRADCRRRLLREAGGTPIVRLRQRPGSRDRSTAFAPPCRTRSRYIMPSRQILTRLCCHGLPIRSTASTWPRPASSDGSRIWACRSASPGPGKRDQQLETAIRAGITINIESEGEAERALAIAGQGPRAPKLAVRVNPPFALKGAGMKMGGLAEPVRGRPRPRTRARSPVDRGRGRLAWPAHLRRQPGAPRRSADRRASVPRWRSRPKLQKQAGAPPPEVNLGGGFGIPYFPGDQPLDVEAVGAALAKTLADRPKILAETEFAIELGRWLVGEAGVYLTRIVDRKESRGETFLVTDGGLQHMLAAIGQFRPAPAPQLSGRDRQSLRRRAGRRRDHHRLPVHSARPARARSGASARRGGRSGRDLLRRRLRPQREPAGVPEPATRPRSPRLGVDRLDEIEAFGGRVEAQFGAIPRFERRRMSSGRHCPRPTSARQPTIERTW